MPNRHHPKPTSARPRRWTWLHLRRRRPSTAFAGSSGSFRSRQGCDLLGWPSATRQSGSLRPSASCLHRQKQSAIPQGGPRAARMPPSGRRGGRARAMRRGSTPSCRRSSRNGSHSQAWQSGAARRSPAIRSRSESGVSSPGQATVSYATGPMSNTNPGTPRWYASPLLQCRGRSCTAARADAATAGGVPDGTSRWRRASRRLAVLIGSVMASVADSAEMSERAKRHPSRRESLMDDREASPEFPASGGYGNQTSSVLAHPEWSWLMADRAAQIAWYIAEHPPSPRTCPPRISAGIRPAGKPAPSKRGRAGRGDRQDVAFKEAAKDSAVSSPRWRANRRGLRLALPDQIVRCSTSPWTRLRGRRTAGT